MREGYCLDYGYRGEDPEWCRLLVWRRRLLELLDEQRAVERACLTRRAKGRSNKEHKDLKWKQKSF